MNTFLRCVRRLTNRYAWINPSSIGYLQYPELWVCRRREGVQGAGLQYLGGDWDEVIDGRVYWSGKYEWPKEGVRHGMLPLNNYVFYTSLRSHFENGVHWHQTEWYEWLMQRSRDLHVSRYSDADKIQQRLQMLDVLFRDYSRGVFRSTSPDPLINIGRCGRIALEDGRHRLCVAKICNVQRIRVQVSTVHRDVMPPLWKRLAPFAWEL